MNGTRESFLSLDLFSLTCTFKNILWSFYGGGAITPSPSPYGSATDQGAGGCDGQGADVRGAKCPAVCV